MEWIQENTMLIEQIGRKLAEVDKLHANTKLHVELNRHLRGAINHMRMIESEGNNANARTKPSINYDSVLADSVCYYMPCLDQYKDKCTCGSAWKTCDNRQTDR